MKSKNKFWKQRPFVAASLGILALLVLTAKKVFDYGATPSKDKSCDYITPALPDQSKSTTINFTETNVGFSFLQRGGTINDASCLNKTAVHGIVNVKSETDIKNALLYAREHNLKVTVAGERHSMGGQTFTQGGLVLDMHGFNQTKLNKEAKTLNVQTGARWIDIQKMLDKENLAVKAMQSINIFTVGGTLSVNAHGIAHDPGPIAPTVKSIRVMLADGSIKKASPTENTELFKHTLGGYGLFGIILDADLEIVDNELYELQTTYLDYKDFPKFYKDNVDKNPEVGLSYSRISVSPTSYLTQTAAHVYKKVNYTKEELPPLLPDANNWLNRIVINFSKTGKTGRWTRWFLEKNIEPKIHRCYTRNQAMSGKEVCLVSRNQEMYDSMGYLKNRLPDTDILQEYFIPQEKMSEFIDRLRTVVQKNKANLLNITIRIVHKDTITALPYAKEDMFAFVLYFNQRFNDSDTEVLRKTTVDLIDEASKVGGAYYLPYQLYYTKEQLQAAYPGVDNFFTTKKKYDPTGLFSNKFYEKYGI